MGNHRVGDNILIFTWVIPFKQLCKPRTPAPKGVAWTWLCSFLYVTSPNMLDRRSTDASLSSGLFKVTVSGRHVYSAQDLTLCILGIG